MAIKIIRTVKELVEFRDTLKGTVGLVPTMGALHLGHMSLVDQAVKDNDYVIVSTFVNPTQFGAGEDFDSYPRTEKEDVALLDEHHATAVFIPKASEIPQTSFLRFTLCRVFPSGANKKFRKSISVFRTPKTAHTDTQHPRQSSFLPSQEA